ncbi:phosphatidate cytidylyltransferase [Kordiimonas sediminis]|uniref:Phosphatidate cytidylyltransferase n=1 Tax=Kordiimonas sediminis TaxID=1735581 RepID=A0A919E8F0_9PROT|nr:phosphatidate cytidylyltransferase [Kordiimonas sediminis]GHF28502.1 phosphatidate cytidylyltransferase [Kordiimonas sediminis]
MPLGLSDNLFKRIIAALVLLPPVIFIILSGGYWLTGLLAVGGVIMFLEWCEVTNIPEKPFRISGIFFILASVMLGHILSGANGITNLILVIFLPFLLIILSIREYDGTEGRGLHITRWGGNGILYVILPLISLSWLRGVEDGAIYLFWTFLIVWATDIGGYFFGKGIGGPKLAPKISPKKTWAGLLGGMLLAAIASGVLAYIINWGDITVICLVSLVVAAIAQMGDLLESAVKRAFGVKDSGGIIPGHGGLLDRVDGLVLAAPAMAIAYDYFAII